MMLRSTASFWRKLAKSRLNAIVRNASARPIIIIGTLDWAYPIQHRPHHLARAIARLGRSVIYVSPRHGRDHILSVGEVVPGVFLTPHLNEALEAVTNPIVYITSTDTLSLPDVLEAVQGVNGHLIYDYLDHLDSTISNGELSSRFQEAHNRILRDEALASVLTSADILYEEVAKIRRKGLALVTNAVDLRHFAAHKDLDKLRPALKAIVDRKQPIIGFFGALASWVDVDLIAAVARIRPGYQFTLMGPVLVNAPAKIGELPGNVSILEPVSYNELPSQAAFFDVLTIPFHLNDVTAATSPLKLFEYMALRKPIVSTPIRESLKYDVVLIGKDRDSFAAAIDRALELHTNSVYLEQLQQIATENSWDNKALMVSDLIKDVGAEHIVSKSQIRVGAKV